MGPQTMGAADNAGTLERHSSRDGGSIDSRAAVGFAADWTWRRGGGKTTSRAIRFRAQHTSQPFVSHQILRCEWQRATPRPWPRAPIPVPPVLAPAPPTRPLPPQASRRPIPSSKILGPTPHAFPCSSPARRSSALRSRWPRWGASGRWRAHAPAPARQSSGWGGRAAAFQNPGEPRALLRSPVHPAVRS
jgi:hypothetical protein